MFETLSTGIDGLDAILGGGIRYPEDTAAFIFVTGDTGTGKTLLGLELVTRAWWADDRGGRTFLFYSIEQSPDDLHKKLAFDFGNYFGAPRKARTIDGENPHKFCIEIDAPSGGANRLVLTHARPATNDNRGIKIDIEWIQAEIGNYGRADEVGMVCIDNVGLLLNDLDYYDKRAALLEARNHLMRHRVHGIFVQEESPQQARFPSAEELSTDVLINLSFYDSALFKSRSIEILKARHQYYYRGKHHFSIAGKGVNRELYLGARSERGPGVHIYPSVAAQLSLARDESKLEVPPRGDSVIQLGPEEIAEAYRNDTGPTALSSTIVLAEPGTRYTGFALHFLANGVAEGEASLLVSTKEDKDAILRICRNRPYLQPLVQADKSGLQPLFRLLYLHPEFLSAGKFASDIMRMCEAGTDPEKEPRITRLAFDNVFQLHRRFPLLAGQDFLIAALLDLLRYRMVTPLFIDHVRQKGTGELAMDPSLHLSTFDNVFHLFLASDGGEHRTYLRILKSVGNEFQSRPFPVSL